MPDITIFQCLPAYRALPANRLIAGIQKQGCRVLLDLEDSISDVMLPGKSALLKQQARIELAKIFSLNPQFKFDVRVNSPHSDEYEKDMVLIHSFVHNVRSIFIPKTENSDTINKVLNDTGGHIPVNPIIETLNGLKNRNAICTPQISGRVEFFFFGNYDFHLDANIFPICEQDSDAYWKVAASLIETVEKDFHFGNSPYSNINDMATLRYSLGRLKASCNKPFAVMSLHKKQTLEYKRLQTGEVDDIPPKIENAHQLVRETYISGKLKGRSFAIDKDTRRIITPQEYLLAINNHKQY
jgi:citrate lyase beta subunit